MEALDPSRDEILRYSIYAIINISISQLWKGLEPPFLALGSKSHGPLSESRVLRRLEKCIFSHKKKKDSELLKNNFSVLGFSIKVFKNWDIREPYIFLFQSFIVYKQT